MSTIAVLPFMTKRGPVGVARSRVRAFTFGPGSLESLRVSVWTAVRSDGRRKKARVEGRFTVYAPSGEYVVPVDETFSGFEGEVGYDSVVALIFAAANGDVEAARDLAAEGVEVTLEDWSDPADDEEGSWA